ncbi:CDT1-like protein a, chloroplastic isoform X2 [Diospyros lotus]|uniref:CDT1-like protein a, chloroplastic isoform X2 n=1 Tax=Diospyros lotus TaxID=55363 RepID=UPI00225A1509|nr:CDT1-like protein a, chloroplastic isoform X2 [Diospyros lotus]
MEDTKYEEREQIASDIKGQYIVPGTGKSRALSPGPVQRPEIVGSHHANPKFASLTPEKPNESLCKMDKKEVAELPERYRILAEYFDRMICSLRLLTLQKRMPIFQNISRQVEILTGRFSYRHLAQIKYILPEAVQTDKVLIHDKDTLCMKPDIKITLLFDVIEGHYQQSIFLALQQVFTSRLLNFSTMHPENCEIPEAEMPEPFNRGNDAKIVDAVPVDLSTECQRGVLETEMLLNTSHLFPSFSRHFSQSVVAEPEKKANFLASEVPMFTKNENQTDEDIGSRQQDVSPDNNKPSSQHQDVSPAIYSKSLTVSNPVQLTHLANCVSSIACEITPSKVASEANNLTIQTPAQLTPKRSVPSCDNKLKIMTGQKWAACDISTKRFLDFSLVDEGNALNSPIDEINRSKLENNIIPQTITKGLSVEDSLTCSVAIFQKAEESCCIGKEQKAKKTGLVLLQQVSASLSNLISLIHQIFQSVKFCSITKEELIHKIIMNNCDVVERREVEDQIDLLEKLVPDWICRNLAPTGNLLYNIKKVSDLNAVRERLSQRVTELPSITG